MKNAYFKYKADIDKWLLIFGFILCLYIFLVYIFSYVAPFVVGFIISLILDPLVNFMQKKLKINRGLIAFFCVAISSAIIIFVGTRIVISIFGEAISFIKTLPQLLQEIRFTLDSFVESFQDMLLLVPEDLQYAMDSMTDDIINSVAGWATSIVGSGVKSGSGSFVKNFPQSIMSIFFTVISSFFFIKDKYKINDIIVSNCHPLILSNYRIIKDGIAKALTGYLKAQLIIMTFTAIISISGLTILNYKYALLVGLVISLVDSLPVLGSGTILIPWALIRFITGDISMGVGLLVIYGVIFVTRQSFEPKILGEQIGVHPLVTLISIYVGLKVFGVLGFLIGPVIAVTVKVLNEAWSHKEVKQVPDGVYEGDETEENEEDEHV